MEEVQDINSLQQDVKSGQAVQAINVLFLDISSSCTGYAIANINFTTKAIKFTKAGAIWLHPDWSHQEKYDYMYNVICNYFWVGEAIDYIIAEQYSINPKKMGGVSVVPEMVGVIKAAAWANGVKVASILPQTWRSQLQIKKDQNKDYKQPTKLKVLEFVAVPEESISNITGQVRNTPSDLYDAIGVGLGWLYKLGFDKNKITFTNIKFNDHLGHQLGRN